MRLFRLAPRLSSVSRRARALALCAFVSALIAPGIATATVITSASDPALLGALVEDFDGEATGEFSVRDFPPLGDGFTITGIGGDLRIAGTWCGNFGSSGNCLETNSSGGVNDDFDVLFDGVGVSAFGFDVMALDTDWTIQTFDASDVMLGQYTLSSQSPALSGNDRRGFFGVTENAPIKYFTVRSAGADDWALVDNLRFKPVPEPGTALLAGLGLIGLALVRPNETARARRRTNRD